MNRQNIRDRFRQENPDITDRTATDDVLNDWLNVGQEELAALAKFLVKEFPFTTVSTQQSYDLTTLTAKFYDIDDKSSGVFYNDKYLVPSSPAQLANKNSRYRQNTSGEPRYWYRRMNTITLDKFPEDGKSLVVSCVLLPDDMTADGDIPFNGLGYLEPLHYGLVAYLAWKGKTKLGNKEAALLAWQEFETYVSKGENLISGNRSGTVRLAKPVNTYQPSPRHRGNSS